MKHILLIIASSGFQPTEYSDTQQALTQVGAKVSVASDQAGIAIASDNKFKVPIDLTLDQVKPENFDGIFIIGGPGALKYLDNSKIYKIMQTIAKSPTKLWGAICISPRILAHANLLDGRNVTGWDEDHKLVNILKKAGANYINTGVVVDQNLITANGPKAAKEFGTAIAKALK